MRPEGCEADLLRALASMPFLDRQEMVAMSGWSRKGAVYEAVQRLETGGVCASVLHTADPHPPFRRFHLTILGLRRLADEEDRPLEELLRYPSPLRAVAAQPVGVPRRPGRHISPRLRPLRRRLSDTVPLVPGHSP